MRGSKWGARGGRGVWASSVRRAPTPTPSRRRSMRPSAPRATAQCPRPTPTRLSALYRSSGLSRLGESAILSLSALLCTRGLVRTSLSLLELERGKPFVIYWRSLGHSGSTQSTPVVAPSSRTGSVALVEIRMSQRGAKGSNHRGAPLTPVEFSTGQPRGQSAHSARIDFAGLDVEKLLPAIGHGRTIQTTVLTLEAHTWLAADECC